MKLNNLTFGQKCMLKGSLVTTLVFSTGIGIGLYFLHQKHEEELDKLQRDTAMDCLDAAAEHYEKVLCRKKASDGCVSSPRQNRAETPFEETEEFQREVDAMNNYESSLEQWDALKQDIERLKVENEHLLRDIAEQDTKWRVNLESMNAELPTKRSEDKKP